MKKIINPWHSLGELTIKFFDKAVREQLYLASAEHILVREQERNIIAREMHDELGQVLASLKTEISLLSSKLVGQNANTKNTKLLAEIHSISNMIDRALEAMRRLIMGLRVDILENSGLRAAIEWQAQEFQARTNIRVDIQSDLETLEISDPISATALFRIFQEALINVARHAKASKVETTIRKNGEFFIMQIRDDGVGIQQDDVLKDTSFGLMGIRERAYLLKGEIDIRGTPAQGTTLTVQVPLFHFADKAAHANI